MTATTRCAQMARDLGLRAAGTAPVADLVVLVEHPLPWPSDLDEDPAFQPIVAAVREAVPRGRRVRVQAVACASDASDRRVIAFVAPEGQPFSGFSRHEVVASSDGVAAAAAALVTAPDTGASTSGVTDVLVCTHGARDVCCGSLGTRLWQRAEFADVRVWRTSHLGGHRFAPTAITFPDGMCWAYLDDAALAGIVRASLPVPAAALHMRGCLAFNEDLQVADVSAFVEHGWTWIHTPRFIERGPRDRIRICYETPTGQGGTNEMTINAGDRVPIPTCGTVVAGPKTQLNWRVTGLRTAE